MQSRTKAVAHAQTPVSEQRKLVTANEQAMFKLLMDCFPQPAYEVFAQIRLGALMAVKGKDPRYIFSQQQVNFFLADKTCKILAVITLDELQGRQGIQLDGMLNPCHCKVLRYLCVPDADRLRSDIAQIASPEKGAIPAENL